MKQCSEVKNNVLHELIRARQEYLLDGRVDLLDPRYRPNASHHPSATRHTTRAQRVTPQARNFLNRCSVFRLIYKYTLNGYFLYFVLCRCAIIYEISNYYYYCYYYCCSLAYLWTHFSHSIASILVVNGDREFTRLNPPSCRVDVEWPSG